MKSVFAVVVLGALAAAPLTATRAAAQQFETLDYNFVAAGPIQIVSGWTCWFPNCRYAPCHMVTVQKPRLGMLRPSVSRTQVPMTLGNACSGASLPGLTIVYTPRPGAHGSDEVVLRSMAENGGRHILRIHVEVP